MPNLVEFLIKIKDMSSGPLAKIGQAGEKGFNKVEQAVNKVTGKLGTLKSNIQQIDAKLDALKKTREISFDTRQIRRINQEIDALQRRKNQLEGNSMGGGLGSMLRSGLAIAGIGSLAYLGTSILKTGMERQMNQVAYEVLAGNKAGDKLYGQELKFAKDTIYGNEAFQEGKLMLGSGVKAKNVMPVQNMIGDIAMGDVERMKSLTLAFSEASSTGHLTGRQELMFRTALFNPLVQLSEMTHKSVASLEKDMAKGKISINDLVKSMEYATGPMGRWHNMMERMRHTPAGEWHAFTGTLTTLAGTIGMKLLPPLGKLLGFMNDLLSNDTAMYAIAAAIGTMTLAWGLYTAATNWAAISTAALELGAMWPIAVAGLIGGAIAWLISANDKYADSTEKTTSRTLSAAESLKEFWRDVIYWAEYAWLKVKSFFEMLNNVSSATSLKDWWHAWSKQTDAGKELQQLTMKREWHKAMLYNGLGDDGKKLPSTVFADAGFGKYDPNAPGAGGGGADDSTKAITGGGVRNITINVQKFQDKTEIHTASFKEGIEEVEDTIRNMFLRIVNSGATALN